MALASGRRHPAAQAAAPAGILECMEAVEWWDETPSFDRLALPKASSVHGRRFRELQHQLVAHASFLSLPSSLFCVSNPANRRSKHCTV